MWSPRRCRPEERHTEGRNKDNTYLIVSRSSQLKSDQRNGRSGATRVAGDGQKFSLSLKLSSRVVLCQKGKMVKVLLLLLFA